MPLSVEVFIKKYDAMFVMHRMGPKDETTAVPQILPDGDKKFYVLECDETDRFSTMYTYHLPKDLDFKTSADLISAGELAPSSRFNIKRGQSYPCSIKTDNESERTVFIFRQE